MNDFSVRKLPDGKGFRLGVGSALSSLEAMGATEILIRYNVEGVGKVVVSAEFPRGVAHALGVTRGADDLDEALRLLVKAVSKRGRMNLYHAASRALVRLPDGGVGTLVYLTKDHTIATVVTPEGRHRSLPAVLLKLVEVPIPEPDPEVK